MKISNCELCGREKPISAHHLIPVVLHQKKHFVTKFGKEEMRCRKAKLCRDCHNHLHTIFSEKELGEDFNTVEILKKEQKVINFITFIRKQK